MMSVFQASTDEQETKKISFKIPDDAIMKGIAYDTKTYKAIFAIEVLASSKYNRMLIKYNYLKFKPEDDQNFLQFEFVPEKHRVFVGEGGDDCHQAPFPGIKFKSVS